MHFCCDAPVVFATVAMVCVAIMALWRRVVLLAATYSTTRRQPVDLRPLGVTSVTGSRLWHWRNWYCPSFYRDPPVLKAFNNTDVLLRLPMGKRIRDIRWLSVWCRRFTVCILSTLFYISGKSETAAIHIWLASHFSLYLGNLLRCFL
jgi:hypothetical protein